jgi:hypothetical protein
MITEIAKEMKSKMNQMANMIVESERCGTTAELTRPRGSANFDLQKLHAKHAPAARVQRQTV